MVSSFGAGISVVSAFFLVVSIALCVAGLVLSLTALLRKTEGAKTTIDSSTGIVSLGGTFLLSGIICAGVSILAPPVPGMDLCFAVVATDALTDVLAALALPITVAGFGLGVLAYVVYVVTKQFQPLAKPLFFIGLCGATLYVLATYMKGVCF